MRIPLVGQVISLVRKPAVPAKPAPRRRVRSREERVRDAFAQAPVGIGIATPDGHWLFVNDRFQATVGYTRDELARLSLHGLTHPEDAKKEAPLMKRLVAGDIDSYRFEKRVMAKNGRYRSVEVLTSLTREAGELDLVVYIIDEPQAPKRHEPARDSDRTMAAVVDQLTDIAVIRTDERGVISGWNAGAEKLFGYTRDEIIGKNRRTLYRDNDSWQGKSTGVLKTAASGRLEGEDWRVTKDGRHLWLHCSLAPLRAEGGVKGFVETVTPPPARAEGVDTSQALTNLRAELDKRRRVEESLRSALDDLRRTTEETMNELRIMTAALRDEIDRRKAAEHALRKVHAEIIEKEEVAVAAPPARSWKKLTSIHDLLRAHAASSSSGTLIVTSGEREKEIFFERGRVFSCASNDPEKFLTHRLLASGAISEEQRQKALEIKQASQLALGRILLILGAIDEQQLVNAMARKVEDEIAELLTWNGARYAFVEGEVPSLQLVPMRIDVEKLVEDRHSCLSTPGHGDETGQAGLPVLHEYVASSKSGKVHKIECISAKRISGSARVERPDIDSYERCKLCFR